MSRVDLVGFKLTQIPDLIATYETDLAEADEHLQFRTKTLNTSLREQGTWPAYYGQRLAELKKLLKYMDAQVSAVRGRLARGYVENYSRALGERVMNTYIDSEPEYLNMYQLYLEVQEIHDKYTIVYDNFTTRSFALRDMTLARVNDVQDIL